MGVLVDTSVVAEVFKEVPDSSVEHWLLSQPDATLYLSSITAAEMLAAATLNLSAARARRLRGFLQHRIFAMFDTRALPFDFRAAQSFSEVVYEAHASGQCIDTTHAMVAAVARANSLKLATRHTRMFNGVKLSLVDPWQTSTSPIWSQPSSISYGMQRYRSTREIKKD
ncbi:MAG: PIN domain-containing protein [Casimicrobium sp.]